MTEEFQRHKITCRWGKKSTSEIIIEGEPDSCMSIYHAINTAMTIDAITSFSVRKMSSIKHKKR